MKHCGWDEFEIGSVLRSFEGEVESITKVQQEDRKYSINNSINASTAHWRVNKPIYNTESCIHCMFCWIFCPDSSILAREKKMTGIDYVHCKGCGVCAQVCPTNPKSLIMYDEHTDVDKALADWPEKEEKKK